MNIRKANNSDTTDIKNLVSSLSHFYLKNNETEIPWWLLSTLDHNEFKARISSHEYINLAYENNKKITGYISIKNKKHIYHLFVSEAHQNQGIATELWTELKNICNSPVYTVRASIYAVKVYEKWGFKKTSGIETKGSVQFQPMQYTQC